MDKILDIRVILKSFAVGAAVMLAVCCIFAVAGTKLDNTETLPGMAAVAASAVGGIAAGVVCGKLSKEKPVVHGILTAVLLGLIVIVTAVLPGESYGNILSQIACPLFILAAPPVTAYFIRPSKSVSRRIKKLRR